MGDILDEAYAVVQCKQCSWYKACAVPLRFTADDIRRQMEASGPGTGGLFPPDLGMQNLMSSMAAAAQNSLLEGCPVFIQRLRASPKLAELIKRIMQTWGQEDEGEKNLQP